MCSSPTSRKRKTIPEDDCELLGNALAQFDEKRLYLKHVLQWPVTSKPWAFCSKFNTKRSSSKSLFVNNLQLISKVSCCIVDEIRAVRMIPITNLTPPAFLRWAKRLSNYYMKHIVFDVYRKEGHVKSLSKEKETKSRERTIASL